MMKKAVHITFLSLFILSGVRGFANSSVIHPEVVTSRDNFQNSTPKKERFYKKGESKKLFVKRKNSKSQFHFAYSRPIKFLKTNSKVFILGSNGAFSFFLTDSHPGLFDLNSFAAADQISYKEKLFSLFYSFNSFW